MCALRCLAGVVFAIMCIIMLFFLAAFFIKAMWTFAHLYPPYHPMRIFLAFAIVINIIVFAVVGYIIAASAAIACEAAYQTRY